MKDPEDKYLGKHLLVGLTYLDKHQNLERRTELHGFITGVSSNTIVFERADNGEEFSIPFDEEGMESDVSEVVFKLDSTGELVEKVDFLTYWIVHPPDSTKYSQALLNSLEPED